MISIEQAAEEICDVGRRIYHKGFAAANDGNISFRASDDRVVCTPTLISKGALQPDDLCVVDMQGRQLSGKRKRTSEIMLHLAIMRARPEVRAVVHCHPPHATAFGIAREPVPQCVLPEVEIFLGNVPITKYAIPGSQEFADTILPFVHKTNVVILANHGTVSFGESLEQAYWWTEMLDAYCKILLIARQLGGIRYFTAAEARELLNLKVRWGFQDPRAELPDSELRNNALFRETWADSGVAPRAFPPPEEPTASDPGAVARPGEASAPRSAQRPIDLSSPDGLEALVEAIADRVAEKLRGRNTGASPPT